MTERDPGSPLGPELEGRVRNAFARARDVSETGGAPTPEEVHDALAGRLAEGERARVLDRAMRSPEGRREVATLHVALHAAREAWPSTAVRWWQRRSVAAAASVVVATALGTGVWWRASRPDAGGGSVDGPLRDVPASVGSEGKESVTLVAPVVEASASDGVRVAWRAVPNAIRYDVELLGTDGTVRWTASTRDTVAAIPPAATGGTEWWVQARLIDGTTRRSVMGRIVPR